MRSLEKTLKALANRRRLAIVGYLKKNGDTSVGDITGEIHASFKATSKHLGVLLSADIVERDQRGLEARYRLSASQKPAASKIIGLL